MQDYFYELIALSPIAAFPIALIGGLLGFYGWRLMRHMVAADAFMLALATTVAMADPWMTGSFARYSWLAGMPILFALPWLAWRFYKPASYLVGAIVGFVTAFLIAGAIGMPPIVQILLAAIGCCAAITFQITLYRQTSVVLSGIHGGFLWVVALSALSTTPSSVVSRFMCSMGGLQTMVPVLLVAFSAILVSFQWADMQRQASPH